ncbi:hypothetical protein N7495_006668 [Penicillium taxi]|uniref:uncharacterized protein n=1 Tax=Penicillium taxi TaxID=168475 RepID=UPI002544DB10|nr:uncharacterized protein N7495_006668 [Penicillium taxi]KAJ5894977.1 hypothetical protein N7495_006668 [Penicillium taxi]
MSVADSQSDYFDDDDFVIPDYDSDDLPTSRPTKRQRVEHPIGSNEINHIVTSDMEDNVISEPESPENHEKQQSRKSRSFVTKHSNIQENIFVTQLTQPFSSPERIRGPKWKKPDPSELELSSPERTILTPVLNKTRPQADQLSETQFSDDNDAEMRAALAASLDIFEQDSPERTTPPTLNNTNPQADHFSDNEDEDMRAALAASLDAFEQDQTIRNALQPCTSSASSSRPAVQSLQLQQPCSENVSFEFEDIPEDAFDSSPLSPITQPVQRTPFQTTANQARALRQSTLFGMIARNPNLSSQQEQNRLPSERNEPPTHHKLNHDELNTWWYPTNIGSIRDYQFNITQTGLFHNLLVALPTGLGKTFIAAAVMLNWFRWTKDAQIIFVAPTKPLVSQQVSACLEIAGIPRSETTMLTGGAAPGLRALEWQSKRVFFMTPQTLINDLKTGIADPKRIILVVVDEAHRATGGYAYVEVVSFLRRFNNSFRVLALTATPGSTVESVQAVVDGLNISRVEIRTEHSIDIREYVHSRNIEIETFENSEEMTFCLDLMSTALQPLVDQLRTMNAYWGKDPLMLTAFGLTKARQQWMGSDAGRSAGFGLKGMVNAIFTVLASLAHSIDLLKYHGITPFYRHLMHFKSNMESQKGGGGKYQKQVVQNESFKKLCNHLGPWTKNPEFIGHPKLEYLKSVILNHFMDAGEGQDNADNAQSSTRVMIFVHFRDSAEEVVRVLKRYGPMIRPHIFVGQSSAKGSEGMNQKTQLQIIKEFKTGTYNTIVATSIGEEGLDIGEVDRIVCYDSSASPIRMLQRMGRTGRKRAGNITLLLMKGKEEESYAKAKDNYEKMQEMIASGTRFTFHDDRSPRILPAGIRPVVEKRIIDIPPENSQADLPEPKRKGRVPKRPPKKFQMPDDVETGFTRASILGDDVSHKTKAKPKKTDTKKADPKKADPKKTDTKKADPKKADPKKVDSKKAEQTKAERKKIATPKIPSHAPSPDLVDIPPKQVALTPKMQKFYEESWQSYQATAPAEASVVATMQRSARPTKKIPHGSLTNRMLSTFNKFKEHKSGDGYHFEDILASHDSAFEF